MYIYIGYTRGAKVLAYRIKVVIPELPLWDSHGISHDPISDKVPTKFDTDTVSFLIAEFLIPQAASNNAAAKYQNAKFRIPQAGENQTVPARNS